MIVKMIHDPGKRGETETKKIKEIFNKELGEGFSWWLSGKESA